MKRNFIPVVLCILALTGAITAEVTAAQEKAIITLPVRVVSQESAVENLEAHDFTLRINGKEAEIAGLMKSDRSIAKLNAARHFILAFNFTEYSSQIADGVSYFVSDILREGDQILVWSPARMHHIDTGTSKASIGETLKKIAKEDALAFKQKRSLGANHIEELLKKYKADNQDYAAGWSGAGSQRTITQFFLTNYQRAFKSFREKYIITPLVNIPKVAGLLADRDGEKFLINFQEQEIVPYYVEYKKIAVQCNDVAAELSGNDMANATKIYTNLNRVEKMMLIYDSIGIGTIRDALLAANISYNTILFRGVQKRNIIGDPVPPDVNKTFRKISESSGGTAVVSHDLVKGLGMIHQHNRAVNYDLIFKMDGKGGDKNISITVTKPGVKVFHKRHFPRKEVAALFKQLNAPGIKLAGLDVKGQVLKFSVSNYAVGSVKDKKKGLVSVMIRLMDDSGAVVYQTRKMLESGKKSIGISLKLPEKYKGKFKISIDAFDLVTEKSARIEMPATL